MSYCTGHAQWHHFWAEADQLKVTMERWQIRIQGGCALGSLRPRLPSNSHTSLPVSFSLPRSPDTRVSNQKMGLTNKD